MAYSGGQQVFSPYAAMGNSPGMMIDPNGEMTKYAEPVQDGDYAVHGGMDAVAVRAYMANGAHMMYGRFFMLGMNTIMAAGGGGGNSMVGGPVTGRGNINRLMSIVKMIDLASRAGMFKNSNVIDVIVSLYKGGYSPIEDLENYSYRYQELDQTKWVKSSFNGIKYEYQFIGNYNKENGGRGVRLAIKIKSPDGFSDVDFIQTVERFGDGAYEQTVDTDPSEPNLPYYWSENRQKGVGPFPSVHKQAGPGYSHYFDDTPGTLLKQKISFLWTAELSLVGKKRGSYRPIITFMWGYYHFKSGDTTYLIPFPIPINSPSNFHNNTINSLNKK